MKNRAIICLAVLAGVSLLQACSIYYTPDHGHKGRGGVVIEIPQKKPEMVPLPKS